MSEADKAKGEEERKARAFVEEEKARKAEEAKLTPEAKSKLDNKRLADDKKL
jgi:hypothetical protein